MILGQWGVMGEFGAESPSLPVAVALSSVALSGNEFMLNGAKSQNADSYLWEQVSGPTATIDSPDSVITSQPSPIVSSPDTMRFSLTVANEEGPDVAFVDVPINIRLKARKVIKVY